jgi:molecular chaperone DnaJ
MDYYAILGLVRGASDAEIKRAYRRLARQYHPGINPGDHAAEAMFRTISEAYATLADPARRSQYDQAGPRAVPSSSEGSTFEFAGFDFSIAAHGSQAATFTELFADLLHPGLMADRPRPEIGADLHASVTIAFLDAMRGGERQVIVTRQVACEPCAGTGQVVTPEGRCVHCQATGKVRWARGHMVFSKTCAACGGTGKQRSQRCAVCGGHGRGVRTEAIPVALPAGVDDGVRLRVPEKGHAGRYGGRTGDLYVTVHVQPHPAFRREGDGLVISVPVAVHEAVLGARIEVPSLEGAAKVRIPPGTQAGQRFRLSERGVPTPAGGRGDLIVEVRLVLPSMVDERSKELMREFGRLNAEDVRKGLMQPS